MTNIFSPLSVYGGQLPSTLSIPVPLISQCTCNQQLPYLLPPVSSLRVCGQQLLSSLSLHLCLISCLPSCTETGYLFDWPLPIHAPELAQELTIPRYFANNSLQKTPKGTLYRESWPSLFIAPKGV